MNSEQPGIPLLFLKPGELVVTPQPMAITTLLGSCVAVTMFCPRLRLGGICHALLPSCKNDKRCQDGKGSTGKYVECAVRLMLGQFDAAGACRSEVQVKLFGGSDMFDSPSDRGRTVGRQNLEMALSLVEHASVRLVTQDLGGRRGRKIIFHPHTGEVFLKRLKKSEI